MDNTAVQGLTPGTKILVTDTWIDMSYPATVLETTHWALRYQSPDWPRPEWVSYTRINSGEIGISVSEEEMKSTTCVVVTDELLDPPNPAQVVPNRKLCGEPVVGERWEFPMCQKHMDHFDPKKFPDWGVS